MHNTRNLDELAAALIDLVGCMNSPRQDDVLLREAGVSLDRALFPLLVCVSRSTSVGVAALAEMVGRDPSTVSRQISKLEELGLVSRQADRKDLRVKEARITRLGVRMINSITTARRSLLDQLLRDWSGEEREIFPVLLRRLVDAMKQGQKS
jgi:DNA-binding MarR family transcriptional regulator